MEFIEKKYETSKKAVARLRESVDRLTNFKQTCPRDEQKICECRDALIKRFELACDICWQYGQVYLEVKAGLIHNVPKSVFRELLRIGLLSEDQVVQALEMVDARNQTTHTYDDEFAEKISEEIRAFCTLLEQFLSFLNPHQQ